ncbi:hypothetical protein MKEN_01084900 [Mycena kentingensis (nom. inval.)]|nr:hypothetical protein MKEN_01084900 [Mycena kentingensis (nom. inval.)]
MPDPTASLPIDCPYEPGKVLRLSIDETKTICDFEIVHTFSPFSLAVVLTARPVSSLQVHLPPLVVLKILDARHVPNHESEIDDFAPERRESGWSEQFSNVFLARLSAFRAEKWVNHWRIAETEQQPMHGHRDERYRNGDEAFALEMDHIETMHRYHKTEVAAYQALHTLQGTDIPKFFGTATYSDTGIGDPVLATVPCLILEYIDGNPLHDFVVRRSTNSEPPPAPEPEMDEEEFPRIEISADLANRASIATIDVVRRFRDLGFLHDDPAPRNILLRTSDRTQPVFIDFGMSLTNHWGQEGYWGQEGPESIREMLWNDLAWHIPSPYAAQLAPRQVYGSQFINLYVPKLDARVREACFEAIPEEERATVPDGEGDKWEPARWRLKTGIRLCDSDKQWSPKSWQRPGLCDCRHHSEAI